MLQVNAAVVTVAGGKAIENVRDNDDKNKHNGTEAHAFEKRVYTP